MNTSSQSGPGELGRCAGELLDESDYIDQEQAGAQGVPEDFQAAGRDGLGDILAVAKDGKVYCFAHGCGDWKIKTLAFESLERLETYVRLHHQFSIPDAADAESLKCLRQQLKELKKEQKRSPYFCKTLILHWRTSWRSWMT
jgi:hypothetical protein